MKKSALITGATGQDGSYLIEYLLGLGYQVHALIRRTSSLKRERIDHVMRRIADTSYYGDLCDIHSIIDVLKRSNPDEVYNLAAQSHVGISFTQPDYTYQVNFHGFVKLLDAIRILGISPRVYQASTSEMFGNSDTQQSEVTPFSPESPYALAKVAAHHAATYYRRAYGMYISCGILFNHESPRRGDFVTRKVIKSLVRIKHGLQDVLKIGNIHAMRDWGFAGDYVKAMHKMLQLDNPDDFVIATGETRSVKDLLDITAKKLDMDWKSVVVGDPEYYRPLDVDCLKGDYTKARSILDWKPEVTFDELIQMMIDYEIHNITSHA